MKLPDKVKVGGIEYEVVMSDKIEGSICGDVCRETNVIRVSKSLPENQMWVTFIHELLHTICCGLDDREIDPISVLIHQIIVDNFKGVVGDE